MGDDSEYQDENGKHANVVTPDADVLPCLHEKPPKREWTVDLARELLDRLREGPPRRLPFETQCAIFAFAYSGTPNRYLVRAFQVSAATVSNITGCLDTDPEPRRYEYGEDQNADLEMPRLVPHDHNGRRKVNRKRRYETVARQFEALGEEAFIKRYLTRDHYKMVADARREMILEKGRAPLE
jgi:hypothetical protein